jgi:hypothetical protein
MDSTSKAKAVEIETGMARDATLKVKVVEVGTGVEYVLPGDAATRDARTLAYFSYPSGAVVPLVLRAADAMFYVSGERWPELTGKLVRRVV